jgi:hypothetical protein
VERGVDWDAPLQVGEKWPAYELYQNGKPKRDKEGNKIPTDRTKILAHMVKKAKKKGLWSTPATYPEGKDPRLIKR